MPIRGSDLQALDRRVGLTLSRRQLRGVDMLAAEFGMSRSWFLREALALGVPLAETRIRKLIDDGYRPAGDVGYRGASVPAGDPTRMVVVPIGGCMRRTCRAVAGRFPILGTRRNDLRLWFRPRQDLRPELLLRLASDCLPQSPQVRLGCGFWGVLPAFGFGLRSCRRRVGSSVAIRVSLTPWGLPWGRYA